MSKAVNNLRKMEKRTYGEWWAAVRYCGEKRNSLLLADRENLREAKAVLTMAIANADRSFNAWMQVCETLDEIELNNHRPAEAD